MNINIKNVEIEVGRKKLDLSIEEAKELRDVLNNAFPVEGYRPYYPYYPITWTSSDYPESPVQTYCGTDFGQQSATSGTVTLRAV